MTAKTERYRGIIPKNPFAEFVMRAVTRACVPEIIMERKDNLDHARELMQKGFRIVFVGNHRSHLDGPIIEDALWRNGYGDIAEISVFLLGKRIIDHPILKRLKNAVNHIEVWPKTEAAETPEEKKRRWFMTKRTVAGVEEVKEKRGILIFFPEGTRSRTGNLQSAVAEVAHYLKGDNVYVLPVGIRDTEKAMPVGELPRPPILRSPKDQVPVTLIFGQPFQMTQLFEEAQTLPRGEQNAFVMREVMGKVEELL